MVFEKVRSIVADQLSLDESEISLESNLVEDLKADSLDQVEMIMVLEQEFDMEFPEEELPKIVVVKDIVDYIESKQNA